ncbi:hypothetical protein NMG60_11006993 [Bertholletia excelsa]
MTVLPSSAAYMAQAIRDVENPERETFHKFFECWLVEQDHYLQELISASRKYKNDHTAAHGHGSPGRASNKSEEQELRSLVERVIEHYQHYYRVKSQCVKQDVLGMLTPSWRSTLEDAFLWIGGWRPTMAFHLLYSKSGLQLEAALEQLILGLSSGDLGDLSPTQLIDADEMQRKTIGEEKQITEDMAKHQETVADSSMVELSHAVSEMLHTSNRSQSQVGGVDQDEDQEQRVESVFASKEKGFEDILQRADDLRLRTLKGVVHILTPRQAVHFLIAAAELHLRLHEWGKKKDASERQQDAQ